MTHKELAKNIASVIESLTGSFEEGAKASQSGMYNRVLAILKDLELSGDTIKPSVNNLNLINKLRGELRSTIINNSYEKKVTTFLSGFSQLKKINDEYFSVIASSFVPNRAKYTFLLKESFEITQASLMDEGINQNIIKPIREVLKQNITTGGSYSDLIDTLRLEIKGTNERLGGLERYVKQITTDSVAQYNRTYVQAVSNDLGLDFYYYAGGLKSTSRKYCIRRAGKYFHRKEVEESARERWSGKNPRTNQSNIFTLAGGYNCDHVYHPVLTSVVPQTVRGRARRKGYEFKE